tara:strand:- start:1487 stop:2398 length:912 start_codon:yes stop_codon:yes gene_type:complete
MESENQKNKLVASSEVDIVSPVRRTLSEFLKNIGVIRNDSTEQSDNLRDIIDQHEEEQGSLDDEARLLLSNLLAFGDLKVRDVMIPRADIIAVEFSNPLEVIVGVFQKECHSRMPVYNGTLDDVLGVVNIKDLLVFWDNNNNFELKPLIREALFVPPSMPVPDLLLLMRSKRIHMALVADEYGGTDGLVTIEDIVESIVGDIEDEHYEDELPLFKIISDGTVDASGRALTKEIEKSLQADFLPEQHDEEIETIAGVVASLTGRVPQRGEIIKHDGGFEFEITQADARRVKKLLIRKVNQKSKD